MAYDCVEMHHSGKQAEILYVANLATALNISREKADRMLTGKPFNETRRGWYLMDIGQMMKLLPEPPGRLLDLGCGPGWTSRMFAMAGYDVVGVDICPEMIQLARSTQGGPNVRFEICDYEAPLDFGTFDLVVIYDALHHATDAAAVVRRAYESLREGGLFLTAEPGSGHSQAESSVKIIELMGTTENDMPFACQKELLLAAGFSEVRQYLRLSELPLEAVSTEGGRALQGEHFRALDYHTAAQGFTSIVVGVK